MKQMVRKVIVFALLAVLALQLTACAAQQETSDTTESTQEATETTAAEESESDSHYPVEVTTYNYAGEEITLTFTKAPERVVAVYQGCIETMIALGLEDHVIASYGLDNEVKEEWQSGFENMKYDDSVFAPDKETVLALEPDMIFSWGSLFADDKLGDSSYWIEQGVNPYINSNTNNSGADRTLENEYTDILNLGKIFDVEDKAQSIVDEMKASIETVTEQTAGGETQTVAVLEYIGDSLRNYGASSLVGDMVTQLGGELAITESTDIGKEDLIAADPDVIFVVYMAYSGDDPAQVKEDTFNAIAQDSTLSSLAAITNDRVYSVMLGDTYASAVRTGDGIDTIAAGLYPDLTLE
ncbi:MAG: ABC transporter substrate-binding protein [Lachnospiraceae bacterium]